jgi:hypothetical protein
MMHDLSKEKVCPACGSSNIERISEPEMIQTAYGSQEIIELSYCLCKDCGFEADIDEGNEKLVIKAKKDSERFSVGSMIENLTNGGYSMAYMERALDLPCRTMTRWKAEDNKISASALALLKTIRTYPWILEVSENQFDYNIAMKVLLRSAINALNETVDPKNNIKFHNVEAYREDSKVWLLATGAVSSESNTENIIAECPENMVIASSG